MQRCEYCLQWIGLEEHRCPVQDPEAFAEFVDTAIKAGNTTEAGLAEQFKVGIHVVKGWREGGMYPKFATRSEVVMFINPVDVGPRLEQEV